MFIYFPEFAYQHLKNFTFNTFNDNVDKQKVDEIFKKKLSDMNDLEFQTTLKSFEKNKLKLPMIKFNHCNSIFQYDTDINVGLISKYDKIENKIEICKNLVKDVNHFEKLLLKELSYAEDYNISYKGKRLGLNDYANMSIKACRIEMSTDKVLHSIVKKELTKRCAYIDLKYKFGKELKEFYENEENSEMDNVKLNETVRRLVDQNIV